MTTKKKNAMGRHEGEIKIEKKKQRKVTGDKRPSLDALYRRPFSNLYFSISECSVSVKLPLKFFKHVIR